MGVYEQESQNGWFVNRLNLKAVCCVDASKNLAAPGSGKLYRQRYEDV